MNEFDCDWAEFKQRQREFTVAAPSLTLDELDNMFKMLSLSFLHMNELKWMSSAIIAFSLAGNTFSECEFELEVVDS